MSPFEARVQSEYDARNLTFHYRAVLSVLPSFRGHGGGIFPSHEAIAQRVRQKFGIRCSVRTVERALNQGRALGLVFWLPQYRRVGWRKLRSSNLYFINVPAGPVKSGRGPVWRRYPTDRQAVGVQGQIVSKKELWQEMQAQAARGPDLLALARQRFEGRCRQGLLNSHQRHNSAS